MMFVMFYWGILGLFCSETSLRLFAAGLEVGHMRKTNGHTFHIPVMGLGYTIDTPIKVARFGISSVISIIEDGLVELLRKDYADKYGLAYNEISKKDPDYRAKRITAYLNLVNQIVSLQHHKMIGEAFTPDSELWKYFELLPEDSDIKKSFRAAVQETDADTRKQKFELLRGFVIPGSIDVNIMTKCDRINHDEDGNELPVEYADAMAALRGFANSDLESSVVFSAGMNPRLYSYCATFKDFLPDRNGLLKKKIILKVSDYRSALVQGKFLAKKGLWVSEFRIESGLNCGGHAFPTQGHLLGPILAEFKKFRGNLYTELSALYHESLKTNQVISNFTAPRFKITVQGGIGTASEDRMLMKYFEMDGTGWGSPFLLVPEATSVDGITLDQLATAKPDDYFLSDASPLGLPFNNFKPSSGEIQRKDRIAKQRPGSPCYKKFLAFNTEFTAQTICTSSREYQHLKIKRINESDLSVEEKQKQIEALTSKDCLCEGLAASVLVKNEIPVPHKMEAVTICPGPNLAYFSGVFSLKEMVDHIYGRINLLNKEYRPHMFMKELSLYVDYFKKEFEKTRDQLEVKQKKYLAEFKNNLMDGISYYEQFILDARSLVGEAKGKFEEELKKYQDQLELLLPNEVLAEG